MNDQERNDLLVRIDTKIGVIETRLEKIESRLSNRLCYTHAEKIKTLEKITWTALLAAVGAIVTSVLGK